MTTRCIIQINNETGEKNVCLTQDFTGPVEDFLVPWPDSKVIDGRVLLIAEDPAIDDALCDTELRGVANTTDIEGVTLDVTDAGIERLQEFLLV